MKTQRAVVNAFGVTQSQARHALRMFTATVAEQAKVRTVVPAQLPPTPVSVLTERRGFEPGPFTLGGQGGGGTGIPGAPGADGVVPDQSQAITTNDDDVSGTISVSGGVLSLDINFNTTDCS